MENVITSKSNEKAKYIKSLNDKKGRQKEKAFYLEGVKVVNEVLDKRQAINLKFIACSKEILQNVNGGDKILKRIENKKNVIYFSQEVFESISDTKTPQGILAVIGIPENEFVDKGKNVLILDKIQDAGNIGTIIRTADAFGIDTVICTKGTVDIYSQKVLRSTMGSILREKIIYTEDISFLKEKGYYDLTIRRMIKFFADKQGAHLEENKSTWFSLANTGKDWKYSAISAFATHMIYAATRQIHGLEDYFLINPRLER